MNIQNAMQLALSLSLSILASSCVQYHQGDFSAPNASYKANSVPQINFQSRVFLINPPILPSIGESMDSDSVYARAKGTPTNCAQFGAIHWKPNLSQGRVNSARTLPMDLQTEFEKSLDQKTTNSKVKRRIKISQNEFSIQKSDLTLYQNNPDPLDVIESLNIFPADILPQKITGNSPFGQTPTMLLRYVKTINDDSNLKITSVTSIKKVSGEFFADQPTSVKDQICSSKVIYAVHYGTGISVAFILRFQKSEDKKAFQEAFGTNSPFSMANPEFTDLAMSAQLAAAKARIELDIAQIGGDIEKTKTYVAQVSCGIDKLESCREARRNIIDYFFKNELKPPSSPDQPNGWTPVNLETISLTNKKF